MRSRVFCVVFKISLLLRSYFRATMIIQNISLYFYVTSINYKRNCTFSTLDTCVCMIHKNITNRKCPHLNQIDVIFYVL